MSQTTAKEIRLAAYIMMASSVLSRALGIIRQAYIGSTIGANEISDVYFASFTIPDFVNHLMATGAIGISFVPLLSKYLADDKKELGNRIFQTIIGLFGCFFIFLVLAGMYFAEPLSRVIAPGFEPDQLELLTKLMRVILPAQLFFYWGGMANAIQYTHKRFLYPALAPIVYNLGIITGGVLLHEQYGVMGFSIGVVAGSLVGHVVIQLIGIKKLHYQSRPLFQLTPELKTGIGKYVWLSLPIALSFSLVVTDEWITKFLASYMESGSISWVNYARREMLIPVSLVQAMGIAGYPFMSRLWAEEKYEQYGEVVLTELKKTWALCLSASVLTYYFATPLTYILFGRGEFSAFDASQTGAALKYASLGIFFWGAQIVLARGLYASHRTWLPSIVGTVAALISLPIYWYLAKTIGYAGLALAGSIGMAIYTVILAFFLKEHLLKHCKNLHVASLVRFCGVWIGYTLLSAICCHFIVGLGIYQETFLSALYETLLGGVVVLPIGYALIKTYLKRYTGGEALF